MPSTFRLNFCRMVWWEVSCASLIRKETSRTTIHDKEYSQYDMWLKTPLMYNHTYFYAIEDVLSNRTHAGRTHHPILWNPSVSPLLVANMSVGDPAECMPSVCCLQVQDVSSMFHKTGSTTVIGAIFWGVIGWCSAAIITASWRAIALPYPCHPHMVY